MSFSAQTSRDRSRTLGSSIGMFLLGLGSQTKFYFLGCLAFSEVAVFILAPFIFLKKFRQLKRNGFLPFIWWAIAIAIGMLVSSYLNHTPYPFIIKKFAVIYAVVGYYLVFYVLLKKNLYALGWFFAGFAISLVVTTFVFNPTAEISDTGFVSVETQAVEDIVGGPLYWLQRIKSFGQLPIICTYLKTPLLYSFLTPVFFVAFALLTSVSGRSAALSVLIGGVMILMGRKSRRTMKTIGKHFWLFVLIGLGVVFLYKFIYQYAAINGLLGVDAQTKYEAQTKGGSNILRLLMSGRKEFFIAIPAVLDKPIFGHGPYAPDKENYAMKFIYKYGDDADIVRFRYNQEKSLRLGYIPQIPTHSHIMGGWVYYGIVGLLFYLWLLYLIYQHIKKFSSAIPQWYGYFSLVIPTYLWHIFFSPFGDRSTFAMFVVCLMFARAIGSQRMYLPYDMEMEARKYD